MQLPSHHKSSTRPSSFRRQVAQVLAAALCLTAAVAIWALVTGRFDSTEARVLGSTLAAAVLTVTGLVGATVLERSDLRRALGLATIALSALEFAFVLAAIWSRLSGETALRTLGVTSALLPACAHACLMLGRLRSGDRRVVRALSRVAVAFAVTAALLVAGAITLASGPIDPVFWRVVGVLVVLAVLATLLAPIVRRVSLGQGHESKKRSAPTATVEAPPASKRPRHSLMVTWPGRAGRAA